MESINKAMAKGSSSIGTNILPDKFRASLHLEHPTVEWRYGKPPSYEAANKLFEEGRTQVWPKGSLEETVQNTVKSWQSEINNKTRLQDFKTINPEKFMLYVNGREGISGEDLLRMGTFNALLKSSLPEEFVHFKAEEETFESAHKEFNTCFPRGFAWEVTEVYSAPPLIAFKFRHWGYFEGPYKGHSPTGELIQFFGMMTLEVDSLMRAEEVHIYYDPGELFGALLKAKKTPKNDKDSAASDASACPFSQLKN
ncbi:pathogen-related protein-like [Momordica charantia]|uniref:Pathogen-related protein-like n=1 Tax=Momordica charantia TaxID=3673 RepID=A0A6J1CLT6_MOMCH|nr:pathogen-related protein-like [Momordica charantia]